MMTETDHIRARLTEVLTADTLLSQVFPFTGDIEKAKLSRAKLLMKNARDNKTPYQQALDAAVGVEIAHLASLIHDDVIDDSDMRRNQASFRAAKGDKNAILYGDYLFTLSVHHIQSTQNYECAKLFVECIKNTCRGETIQDLLLNSADFKPTLEIMAEVAKGKTGALFAFCTQAPACINSDTPTEVKTALNEIGHLLGLAYQLADDFLDIISTETNLGKPVGHDLQQNCLTTPLLMMAQETGQDWYSFRQGYLQDELKIKTDFLNSNSYTQIKAQLSTIKQTLDQHIETCTQQHWHIDEIVDLFWLRYIKPILDES